MVITRLSRCAEVMNVLVRALVRWDTALGVLGTTITALGV